MEFEVILPIAISDYETASLNIPRIMRFLHPKSIIVIGRKEIGEKLRVDFPDSSEIRFLNEDTVVPGLTFSSLHSLLKERQAEKRTGWYFQQFIKMAYSLVSDTEFYLSWDADTLPLREKKFFTSSGVPLFSLREEFHKPYFETLGRLLSLQKNTEGSFITEHMLFKKSIMMELLRTIEAVHAGPWFAAVLQCVADADLPDSGFSEFETYGTYVMQYHKGEYDLNNLNSIRFGRRIFGSVPKEAVLAWLGKQFDTISFEKWDRQMVFSKPYESGTFRKLIDPRCFIGICNLYAGLMVRMQQQKQVGKE